MQAGRLVARAEERDRAERVGADEDAGAPATRAPPPSTSGSASTGRNRNGVPGSDDGTTCSGTPSRSARAAPSRLVPVEQLDHAGRLAERADALLDAVAVDRVDQPDAAVDGERVRRASHALGSRSSRSRRRARRRSGCSRALVQLREGLLEHLVRLGSQHEQPAVEQERRNRVRADRRCLARWSPRSGHGSDLPRAPPRRRPPAARARGPDRAARPGRRCPGPRSSRRPSAGRARLRGGRGRARARSAAARAASSARRPGSGCTGSPRAAKKSRTRSVISGP